MVWADRDRLMGKPSGSNTTTTQSGPPAQVLANYEGVYNQAQSVANQPQQSYSGPTLAGFTPMQTQGFNDVNTAANAGQPFINQASQDYTNASTALNPANFGGTVSQYESPYTQQVVNATQAQFNNQNAIQQNQLAGNAASAGAFGGDRQAVAQSVLAGQQQLNQAPTIANLYNTGFQNASNAAQSNAWLNSQAGSGMANLGQEAQGQGLTAANAELTGGAQQQALEQQELNIPYQAWQSAQSYPFQTTNWLEGMATGTGSLSGGTGSTTTPGPSTASQVAGLGLTGLAGYNLYNQSGLGAYGGSDAAAYAAANQADAGLESTLEAASAARGGRIGGFAPGGAVPGDVAINVNGIPTEGGPQSNGLLGGGGNLLQSNTGTTSTTTGGANTTGGEIGSLIGMAAGAYFGGPAGASIGSQAGNQIGQEILRRGGKASSLEEFARKRLPPVPVRPRGFDTGGDVGSTPTGLTASVGGNPMLAQLIQTYAKMPTDQLQQMAMRSSAGIAGGQQQQQAAQRALQMRRMNPASGPQASVPGASQGGMSPMSGQPGQQAQGQTPGMAPMPSMFARGGEADDDDGVPDLVVPQIGPSIPGGGMAGFDPVPAEAALAPIAGAPVGGGGGHAPTARVGSYVPPPASLAPLVEQAAAKHGVDPKPLAWMLSQESHWNPAAYNPLSGTKGIGQFKDATAKEVGIDPYDPAQAIDGAARYLRTKLEQNGGDYERAIGRYGTFSTGHGKEADEAVRQSFRAFMQGAKRGGAIRRADGGAAVDLDANGDPVPIAAAQPGLGPMSDASQPDTYGGETNMPARSRVQGMTTPRGAAAHVSDGGGGTIPLPPIPPSDGGGASPQAGLGAMQPKGGASVDVHTGDDQSFKANPWESLLTAGLGMMAGKSPHALENIGAGGLAGVKDYQTQRQLGIQDQMRADAAKTNAVWRAGQISNAADRTAAYKDATAARATAAQQATQDREAAQQAAAAARQDNLTQHQQDLDFREKQATAGTFSFQPATQADPDNPDKTVAGMMRLNNKTGESQFIPTNTNPNKAGAGAGAMGAREGVMFQRVVNSGNAATTALSNIAESPYTTDSGWFGPRQAAHTMMGAFKESLANNLTSQDVQSYNTMLSGVSRNLATLETAGLAPGGSFTESMNNLAMKQGDTEMTKLQKMAEMRQIIETNLEPSLHNPRLPPEMKDYVKGIISKAQQVVPYTQHDLIQLQASGNPRATLADVARTKGLGGGQAQQPTQGAARQPAEATQPPLPTRPPNVPAGSAYSPSRNAWRTPDGTVIPGTQ